MTEDLAPLYSFPGEPPVWLLDGPSVDQRRMAFRREVVDNPQMSTQDKLAAQKAYMRRWGSDDLAETLTPGRGVDELLAAHGLPPVDEEVIRRGRHR